MKRIGTAVGVPVIVCTVLLWMFFPFKQIVAIEPMPDKEELYFLPVSESEHFQLQFIHSVHLSQVIEEYEVQKDKLIPVQLIYEDTAIGMPSNAGEGETFEVKNGKYHITDLKGSHASLDLNIGQVKAEHTINYNGESFLLKNYIEAGSWVRIEPSRASNWELWRGVRLE